MIGTIRKEVHDAKVSELQQQITDLQLKLDAQTKFSEQLQEQVEQAINAANGFKEQAVKPDESQVVFKIQNDLKVGISMRFTEEVIENLIKEEYLPEELKEDDGAISVAGILICNELTEQYISDINGDLVDE